MKNPCSPLKVSKQALSRLSPTAHVTLPKDTFCPGLNGLAYAKRLVQSLPSQVRS
ncbi:Uncharacterised protein [Mycobacterium tuberculosis]|nr:Uncharacterised protein [Mycobacterium tuberculosis]